MSSVEVRKMTAADVPAVARIEEACFSRPWSEKSLRESLEAAPYTFYVAVNGDDPVGYIGAYLTGDELNLTNLAVFPLWRKRGVGTALLREVMNLAAGRGLYGVTLEVRESNLAAIALYRKFGFTSAGKRKNYYDDPAEDALILWRVFEE